MNAKNWRACVKDGVTVSKPVYAAQIAIYQAYMEPSVPGISAAPALFTAINKDTAELHHELVPFDADLAQRMSDRAVRILQATDAGELLPRIAANRDFFECRFCAHAERCWEHGGMTDEPTDPSDPRRRTTPCATTRRPMTPPEENIVHFNPWRDFNDAAPQIDVFGDEPDPEQIAQFMQVVFGYCDGLIPVRSFIDKGQGIDGRPHNIWLEADQAAPEKMATFATWASREGAAVYVIPGTVAAPGQAKAAEILQMQTVVVDLDTGDIAAKRAHLERHLGAPTMVVESGGVTPEGQRKAHVWWTLTEPAEGDDIRRVCRLRGDIAAKVGGDMHFRSAHQPIRVAGSVYYKNSLKTQVRIVELNADRERDLAEFIEAVTDMPPAPGVSLQPEFTPSRQTRHGRCAGDPGARGRRRTTGPASRAHRPRSGISSAWSTRAG